MTKAYQLISKDVTSGRNGQRDYVYVVAVKKDNNGFKKAPTKTLYVITLHCEYIRINKEGKTENIYRCTISSGAHGYRIYSGFEHPKSSIEYFLRKAKILPNVETS